MTIDEFCKPRNYPKMKVLGELKNFRYYVSDYNDPEMYRGLPIIVIENKVKHTFSGCDPEKVFEILNLFEE